MVSSVTEGHIKKLRKAGYLSNNIMHRLPDKGHPIPTPRPHERVVFTNRENLIHRNLATARVKKGR